ncbi:MAG: ImmA/IrrE family metallo-endopeptidase [Actinomycetota bacterium]|nr:ImmA/IrrE family metallo-endopeptidase [Actinomycetota bacterium]
MNLNVREAGLARAQRLKMGFSAVEPIEMPKVYRILGITCVKRPMESQLSGVFVRSGKAEVVLINSAKSLGHQNFTLAHELYHALFDHGLETRACHPGFNEAVVERQADEFASHLLMPIEGIQHMLHERGRVGRPVQLGDIIYLEQIFGVSHKAALSQLKKAGLIPAETAQAWEANIREAAKHLGYDEQLYCATGETTLWSDYAEMASQALEAGTISFGKYEELLSDAGILDIEEEDGGSDVVD